MSSLLTVLKVPRGRWGVLGIAYNWRQEEAGSEFLLKSCTLAPGKKPPWPLQEPRAANPSAELAPAG